MSFRLLAKMVFAPLAFFYLCCCYGAGPFTKTPYIQFPAPDTVTILWESATNDPGTVRFGPGSSLDKVIADIAPEPKQSQTTASANSSATNITYYLYRTSIRDLMPGTIYNYQVSLNGSSSEPRQFRTLDPHAATTRFVVYGDSRSDPKIHLAVAGQFDSYHPDFILHTGDLVAKGKDYSLWGKEFFGPMSGVIDHLPFFSVLGNHEQDGTNYLNYFELPGQELWYSLDVGPVHVLALDFRYDQANHPQFRFAQKDLANSRAPWKVVVLHTPLNNIGGHASSWGHKYYLPLFQKSRVDLVLSGHSHLYERFKPLAPKSQKDKWCITHITTGGGGANLHTVLKHPSLVVKETTNHFMVFEASSELLRGKAIRVDGSMIDIFQLEKPGGKPNRDYFARAYDQEALDMFYACAPVLGGRASGVPTQVTPAEVQFVVPPRVRSGAVRLDVSLTPESARYYKLLQEPVPVFFPNAGTTNAVWVKVLSTGATNVVENKSKELVPPLAFQAVAQAKDESETLVYGGRISVANPVNLDKKSKASITADRRSRTKVASAAP